MSQGCGTGGAESREERRSEKTVRKPLEWPIAISDWEIQARVVAMLEGRGWNVRAGFSILAIGLVIQFQVCY